MVETKRRGFGRGLRPLWVCAEIPSDRPLGRAIFYLRGEPLRIKGRLSGFEVFATKGPAYDDEQYDPINKRRLEGKLQWTADRMRPTKLKAKAMPEQIDPELYD